MLSRRILTEALLMSLLLGAPITASADDAPTQQKNTPRSEYKFPQVHTPKGLAKYSLAIYGFDNNSLFTCRKSNIITLSKKNIIDDIVINPAGINFMVLSKDNKKPQAAIFDLTTVDNEIFKLKIRKSAILQPCFIPLTPEI